MIQITRLDNGLRIITDSMPRMRSISIGGSYVGSLGEMRELVELAKKGVLPPLPLSSHQLSDVQSVLDALRSGKVTGRAILQY